MSTYKEMKTFDERKAEAAELRVANSFFNKIPVVFEPRKGPGQLEQVPMRVQTVDGNASLFEWDDIIRTTLGLSESKMVILTVADKQVTHWFSRFDKMYEHYRDEDGFLYLNYHAK